MEAIPLVPLDAGTPANYAFWIRYVLALAALTPGILSTFQSFLPELKITTKALIMLSILAGVASAGFAFGISLLIGFPVPFTLIASSPAWFAATVSAVIVAYGARLRDDSALRRKFIRCWLMLVWFVLSIVLYTIYVYGFQHFDSVGQVFYVSLLPLLKIANRNVFNHLFRFEYIGQSIVALRDIDKMMRGINWICGPLGAQYTASSYMLIPSEVDQPAQGSERSGSHNAIRLLTSVSSKLQITDPPPVLLRHVQQCSTKLVPRIHPTLNSPEEPLKEADSTGGSQPSTSSAPTERASRKSLPE